MTFEQASKLVELLTEIAVMEVERKALDSDHWEHAEHLTHHISVKRFEAIALLETEEETADEADMLAAIDAALKEQTGEL